MFIVGELIDSYLVLLVCMLVLVLYIYFGVCVLVILCDGFDKVKIVGCECVDFVLKV